MAKCFLLQLSVELLLRIIEYLDSFSVFAVRRTCEQFYDVAKLVWSVDSSLGRFVTDSQGFRTVMRDNGAVVAGALPLQFFARQVWTSSSMDVFVPEGKSVTKLSRYLVNEEGYCFKQSNREVVGFPVACNVLKTD